MNSTKDETVTINDELVAPAAIAEQESERVGEDDLLKAKLVSESKKKNFKKAAVVVSLIVVGCCVGAWLHLRAWESTDDAQIDGHIYPVSARVGGKVVKVLVDDGQFVHAGETLVQIDPSEYQLAVDRAEADFRDSDATAKAAQLGVSITRVGSETQITGASADLASAEAGVASAQESEKTALAQLTEANAAARKLNADVERDRQLLLAQVIARQQFDQAVASADAANATVAARQAALAAAHEQIKQADARRVQARSSLANAEVSPKQVLVSRARSEAAQAQVLHARASLEQARLNLRYTTIVAPVDGVVGRRAAQVGQNLQPNEDLLAVVPLREIWVTANFKETQLKKMGPGQEVEVKVDTYGGRKWRGHVIAVGGATGAKYSLLPPENATGNYVKVVQRIPVRIEFDDINIPTFNRDGLLRPGMSVVPDVRVD